MARIHVKYTTVSASPNEATVKAEYKGVDAVETRKNYGLAKAAAREACIAKWEAAGSLEPAPPATVRSNPLPAQVPPAMGDMMALFAQFLVSQGVSPAAIQAPVQAAPTPAPKVETPKVKSGLVAPPDPKWFETRAEAILLVRGLQKELGFKVINGSGFKTRIDKFMAQKGCEPVYEGRTKAEVNRLNTAGSKVVAAHIKALKAGQAA